MDHVVLREPASHEPKVNRSPVLTTLVPDITALLQIILMNKIINYRHPAFASNLSIEKYTEDNYKLRIRP